MSPTGEQPIAKAEPALSLSFDRAVVLLGLFASLAGVYAGFRITQSDVEKNSARLTICEARQDVLRDQMVKLDKESATKADVAELTKATNALTLEVRTFIASFGGTRTNNANYRPRPTP